MYIKENHPNANIIYSNIPQRNDSYDEMGKKVNDMLNKSLPESIYMVNNKNITKEMLYDRKHINKKYINILVKNMKDKLRMIIDNGNKQVYGCSSSDTRFSLVENKDQGSKYNYKHNNKRI